MARVEFGKLTRGKLTRFHCKCFPPHLNNVSTLPCETWNARWAHATYHCYQKKLQNLFHCNCGLQIRQIWIQLITACGKYCKRRCTKHSSLIWSYDDASDEWLTQWRHDPAWPTPFSVAVSVRPDHGCVFLDLFLQQSSHAVFNRIQIWRIWRPQLMLDKFWSFYYNSMIARVW